MELSGLVRDRELLTSAVLRSIAALLTGAVLGFAGIFFGIIGAAIATGLLVAMAAYYASRGRFRDVGCLLLGAGIVVLLILGRPLVQAFTSPSEITVALPTYLGGAAGILLFGLGVIVLVGSAATRKRE